MIGDFRLQEVLEDAGAQLFNAHTAARPTLKKRGAKMESTFRISVNDASRSTGGLAKPHKTHRNGMSADLRPLRRLGYHAGGFKHVGGKAWDDVNYDRDQNRKIVEALAAQPQIRTIYYNDPVLLLEVKAGTLSSKMSWHSGHDNHLHIAINTPPRQGVSSKSYSFARDCKPATGNSDQTRSVYVADSYVNLAKMVRTLALALALVFRYSTRIFCFMGRFTSQVRYPIQTSYIIANGVQPRQDGTDLFGCLAV